MNDSQTIVLRFGDTALLSPADRRCAVDEVCAHTARGARVVAVVAPRIGSFDALLRDARAATGDPDPRALASLLATASQRSAAILSLSLDAAGVSHRLLDARQAVLLGRGPRLNAEPVAVGSGSLAGALEEHGVVVIPGGVLTDEQGDALLMGRDGADLTAVLVGRDLGAEVCMVDVDASGDQAIERERAQDSVDPRAKESAARWRVPVTVAAPGALQDAGPAQAPAAMSRVAPARPDLRVAC